VGLHSRRHVCLALIRTVSGHPLLSLRARAAPVPDLDLAEKPVVAVPGPARCTREPGARARSSGVAARSETRHPLPPAPMTSSNRVAGQCLGAEAPARIWQDRSPEEGSMKHRILI